MDIDTPLQLQRCIACKDGMLALSDAQAQQLLASLVDWQRDGKGIVKIYHFKNHYETLAFVNALAWVSHRTDHHPDLLVGYNQCRINYWTHAANGLSINDFICAAKADALLAI